MKGFFAIFLALLTFLPLAFVLSPQNAYAQVDCNCQRKVLLHNDVCSDEPCNKIAEEIEKIDKCYDSVVIIMDRAAFICVRTRGVFSKTNHDAIQTEVKGIAKKLCPKLENIFVTTAVKPYAMLRDLSDPCAITLQQLFELFIGKKPIIEFKPMG